MTEIKLSVIIGTYNQKERLEKVLLSLFKQTLSPYHYEIVVVDSMSIDGTDSMIQSLSTVHCPLNYIRQENNGKTAARNRGIFEARGKIIFLTDADMLADPNLLQEHLQAHEKRDNAAFEGLTINPDGKPYIKERIKSGQKLKWSYFLSGNLSIPKDIIKNAGMFDTDFKSYGWEDIELGYRLHRLGHPLYYLPSAVNHHIHPVTREEMFERKYNMGRSAMIFYRKHKNLEIKYFLGMNPLSQGIYGLMKRYPRLRQFLEARSDYIREEFMYRKGLEEAI